jgi:hypothetical protein
MTYICPSKDLIAMLLFSHFLTGRLEENGTRPPYNRSLGLLCEELIASLLFVCFGMCQVNSMVDTLKVILEEVGRVAREVGVEGQSCLAH